MRFRVPPLARLAGVLCLGAALSGCASGARTGAMTPELSPSGVINQNSPLRGAVQIGSVTGGSETNPLWKSKVSNDNFRSALEQALQLYTMTAADRPRFVLDAELVELKQPFAGFDMTVTASVHYRLRVQDSQQIVMDEVIATPYQAKFGDALLGYERLRLANEGAVRENITAAMQKLVNIAGTLPTS